MRRILRQEEVWFSTKPTVCGCCGEKSDVIYLEGEKKLTKGEYGFSNNFSAPLVCLSCVKRIMAVIEEELNTAALPKKKATLVVDKEEFPDIEIEEDKEEVSTVASKKR